MSNCTNEIEAQMRTNHGIHTTRMLSIHCVTTETRCVMDVDRSVPRSQAPHLVPRVARWKDQSVCYARLDRTKSTDREMRCHAIHQKSVHSIRSVMDVDGSNFGGPGSLLCEMYNQPPQCVMWKRR